MALIANPASASETSAASTGDEQPSSASQTSDGNEDGNDEAEPGQIVVSAERIRGQIVTDAPPIVVLKEEDIASYGVSSIQELLTAISPQTGSSRGRGGGGQPIVLVNGERVASFREIRNIPPEAIRTVEVLPEEVALQFGYRPDQRVVNFILKDNFSSLAFEADIGGSTAGGYAARELEANYTLFKANGRINVTAGVETTSFLTEAERSIIQTPDPAGSISFAGDPQSEAAFRTLLPRTREATLNASISRILRPGTTLSGNASISQTTSDSLFGLDSLLINVPGTSPFSVTGADALLLRRFDGPLARDNRTRNGAVSLGFNTRLSLWNLSITGDFAHAESTTDTDRSADLSAINAAIAAGTLNPFAADLGALRGGRVTDRATSRSDTANALATLSGAPFELPAGEVTVTFKAGYGRRAIESETTRNPAAGTTSLKRDSVNTGININLPVASRDKDVLGFIGELSVNANAGYSDLSDLGGLVEYGAGFVWAPVKPLTLSFSYIGEEAAPSVEQLGNPLISTPNVTFYDFTRGESVLATSLTGGNPLLTKEKRRDIKIGANLELGLLERSSLSVEYARNRSFDTSNSFPVLTPQIEAAFPGRVVRDTAGRLLSVDQRPVTFDRVASERLRTGLNLGGSIGSQDQGRGGGAGGPGGGRGPGAGPGGSGAGGPGAGGPGAGPRMPGFGPGGRGNGGRWNVSLYHVWRLDEKVRIATGIPEFDLLDGDAVGGDGGVSRHALELEGGMFYRGYGFRLSGNYQGKSRINGTGLPGSSDLFFGDIATFNLRVFADLNSRESLIKAVPFFKGSRISLGIDNVFGATRDVRDSNGAVPLRYQPGYLNPQVRMIEIDFRKAF